MVGVEMTPAGDLSGRVCARSKEDERLKWLVPYKLPVGTSYSVASMCVPKVTVR